MISWHFLATKSNILDSTMWSHISMLSLKPGSPWPRSSSPAYNQLQTWRAWQSLLAEERRDEHFDRTDLVSDAGWCHWFPAEGGAAAVIRLPAARGTTETRGRCGAASWPQTHRWPKSQQANPRSATTVPPEQRFDIYQVTRLYY